MRMGTTGEDMFFGRPDQIAMLKRGSALHAVLRDDPRLTYYGRAVGIATPADAEPDLLEHLVTLQGSGSYGAVQDADMPTLTAQIEARGLSVTRYRRWTGGVSALSAARRIIAEVPLPDDLTVQVTGEDTPGTTLARLAEVGRTCGVLCPAGSVMRGRTRPGVGIVAIEPRGRAVACAGAAAYAHRDHPVFGGQSWWGMLATHPDRRGARIALVLGAMAMIRMHDRYGFDDFFTGVQPGNAASEALCRRAGLSPDGASILNAVDPAALEGGKLSA